MGIDKVDAPGFATNTKLEENAGKREAEKEDAPETCAGGDVAAGQGGTPDDQRTVVYDDGSSYSGQIQEGKRHGQGVWKSQTGQYEGQWQADVQHGKGRQTWSDGRVYDGQFECGKFAGHGRMVWHTNRGLLVYEGQYEADLKHGDGKFVWADGRTYNGQWREGKRHGRGVYTNARMEQKSGFWVDDKFDRWEQQPTTEPQTNNVNHSNSPAA